MTSYSNSSSRTHPRDEALLDYVAEEYGGSVEFTVGVPYCGKKVAQHEALQHLTITFSVLLNTYLATPKRANRAP